MTIFITINTTTIITLIIVASISSSTMMMETKARTTIVVTAPARTGHRRNEMILRRFCKMLARLTST